MTTLNDLVRELGSYKVEKGGQELIFKCPKCHRRKFYVNPVKQMAHCFFCSFSKRFPRLLKKAGNLLKRKPVVPEDQPITLGVTGHLKGLTEKTIQFLDSRGVTADLAYRLHMGMGEVGGRVSERLIIPIIENGQTMCWVARAVNGESPKELSGPNRSHFFYGYDEIDRTEVDIVLVEGIFDQIKIRSFDYYSLALMGSSISDVQIGKLAKLDPFNIVIMMDGDEAGRKATETIAAKLGKRINPFSIKKVYLPEGMDPDQLTRDQFLRLLK